MSTTWPVSQPIYLAGRFRDRQFLREVVAEQPEAAGHVITSTWIRERAENPAKAVANARRDLRQIDAADVLICHCPESRRANSRSGFALETGYAFGCGKKIIIVGERTNIFTHLPEFHFFKTWPECLASLSPAMAIAA